MVQQVEVNNTMCNIPHRCVTFDLYEMGVCLLAI